jgi:hypothetical protein
MRLMDRLIDSQSSAMDDNDPIEEWVQTLVAERLGFLGALERALRWHL